MEIGKRLVGIGQRQRLGHPMDALRPDVAQQAMDGFGGGRQDPVHHLSDPAGGVHQAAGEDFRVDGECLWYREKDYARKQFPSTTGRPVYEKDRSQMAAPQCRFN